MGYYYFVWLGVLIEKWVLPLEMFDCKYDSENFKKNKTKNDNSSCERAHAIFRWASTIFCWASTCQFLITRLLIGQRASYNRFFHWLFPDANDGSNDRTKDHRSFPNMKLPTAAIMGLRWSSANCWFSRDVTKFQTSELLILLRFYFHDVLEQLKTNIQTNFHSKWVLGLVIDYSWISKLLRDVAFTWRARELLCWFKRWLI